MTTYENTMRDPDECMDCVDGCCDIHEIEDCAGCRQPRDARDLTECGELCCRKLYCRGCIARMTTCETCDARVTPCCGSTRLGVCATHDPERYVDVEAIFEERARRSMAALDARY